MNESRRFSFHSGTLVSGTKGASPALVYYIYVVPSMTRPSQYIYIYSSILQYIDTYSHILILLGAGDATLTHGWVEAGDGNAGLQPHLCCADSAGEEGAGARAQRPRPHHSSPVGRYSLPSANSLLQRTVRTYMVWYSPTDAGTTRMYANNVLCFPFSLISCRNTRPKFTLEIFVYHFFSAALGYN